MVDFPTRMLETGMKYAIITLRCASAFSTAPVLAFAADTQSLHRGVLVLDSHLDTPAQLDDPAWDIRQRHSFSGDGSQVDLPRMEEGGLDGGFWVAFTPQGALTPEGFVHARRHVMKRLTGIRNMVARNDERFALAFTAEDAARIAAQGKIVVYQSIENAYPVGGSLSALATFHEHGVRMLGLVHMTNNQLADSANDPGGPRWNGLSPLGRDLVKEANRLGLVLDGSHASDAVVDQLLELSEAPIILSHSGCRDLFDRPRNIDDKRIKAIAAKGGVIQISGIFLTRTPPDPEREKAVAELLTRFGNIASPEMQAEFDTARAALIARYPLPRATFNDFMDNLLHALKLVGPSHVGIGVDWDGGTELIGFEDVSALPKVTERLLKEGYSASEIANIWGGNLLRILTANQIHAGNRSEE